VAGRSADVKVTGHKALRRRLQSAPEEVRAHLRKADRSSAETIATEAERRSPRKDGDLRNAIKAQANASMAVVVIGGGKVDDYVGRVVFGDPRPGIKGNDFPYEALRRTWDDVIEFYQQALDDFAKKIGT